MNGGIVLDLFAGPGGWDVAARALGLRRVAGLELDAAACATRAAAGHHTIRADITKYPAALFAGRVTGTIGSPVCTQFSAAGKQAGNAVLDELAGLIRDAFAGRRTRAARRRAIVRGLRAAGWPPPRFRPSRYNRKYKIRVHLTRAERSAALWDAARSAALVAEPARFIAACRPEWVALEQVPSVLPLWEVYAAELRKLGYSAWCGVLNSADYGVPQTRRRAILIASRVRTVTCPPPTHYDPREGMQLFGTPWVSMADALGMGATARPAPTVTSGGTATGGAEPFGHRDRDMLTAERDDGRWALHRNRGASVDRRDHPMDEPAPTITGAGGKPGGNLAWTLHTNRDQREDGTRQTADPHTAPAPALTAKSGGQWVFRNNNNNNACTRGIDEPAGTLFFGHRSNWAAWVQERPATTVLGEPRVGRPGHKGREAGGESHFAVDSVRITVQEAAVLQSFGPGYPWRGTKTKQFEQCGNAWCPLAAIAVLGAATGLDWRPVAEEYAESICWDSVSAETPEDLREAS